MHRGFDPSSGQPSVAPDVEQSAADVVVVAHKIKAGLIDAHHLVPAERETSIVEPNQIAQHAHGGSISRCQDHGVKRLFRVV